jgi:LytS/YehU family sensor histidine kinase
VETGSYRDLILHLFFNLGIAMCLLLAVVVADRVSDTMAGRRRPYVIAIVVSAVGGATIEYFIRGLTAHPFVVTNAIWRAMEWLLIGGFATFLYVHHRQSLATLARLRASELNRIARSKEMIEAKLKVMQARVEPQFLFNTLAQVRKLFQVDPGLAERMLDELIAYLRAAMPKMRDTSSTLGQEVDLARAYLAIVKLRLGDRLAFAIDIPPGSRNAPMPPMILLPLVDHAIVHGLEQNQIDGALRVAVEIADGRLRLIIVDSGAGFVPEAAGDGIAGIRERLAALYGNDARLELTVRDAGSTEAIMEIPCQFIWSRAA